MASPVSHGVPDRSASTSSRARPAISIWCCSSLCGAFLFCRAVVTSPFGQVLAGIRDNELKTRALGYNTRAYRMAIVVLAYALGGLAGALYAPLAGFASPELFFWRLSGMVLIMVIVGGRGTLIGPIIGGAFFLLRRA